MSKDKEKSLPDKLKSFLKTNKGNLGSYKGQDYILPQEILKDLSAGSPIPTRLKTINLVIDSVVKKQRLEDTGVEKIWSLMQDLIAPHEPQEIRHQAFKFLECLIKTQFDRVGIMRLHFFRLIKENDDPRDIVTNFEILQVLSDNGKDILYFEDQTAPLILKWMNPLLEAGQAKGVLKFSVRFFKFNAALIDEESANEYIKQICTLLCATKLPVVVLDCLALMDTIVAYSQIPPDSLPQFVGALCRAVNGEEYCTASNKIMKNLLGTRMGHATLVTMCRILQEPCLKDDPWLLRGAVFYISHLLWGTPPVTSLKTPPSAILPSLLQVIKCNQPLVSYEMVLAMQRLILRHGAELLEPAWDSVLTILSYIIRQIEVEPRMNVLDYMQTYLHDTLNSIESLIEAGTYDGCVKSYFHMIGECSRHRPDNSVMKLIKYLSESLSPAEHLWLTNLYNLLVRFFKNDTRVTVRLAALNVLSRTYDKYRILFEDELLDRIVVPIFNNIQHDAETTVKCAVVEFLLDAADKCETKQCLDMLDILEKILRKPFEQNDDPLLPVTELADINTVVTGLIKLLQMKIHHLPSSHAVKILKIFIGHLEEHYKRPHVFAAYSFVRQKIFECLLQLRANASYHLGAPCIHAPSTIRYSKYLCVTYQGNEKPTVTSPPPVSPVVQQNPVMTISYVPVRPAFIVVVAAIRKERNWEILKLLLEKIPLVLQNRALILTKQGNTELSVLIRTLNELISDKEISFAQWGIAKTDFQAMVLTVLAHLASYHAHIEPKYHQSMIGCLYKACTIQKCVHPCINSLTTCTLEMEEAMVKILPDVLLYLSKISARPNIAVPILEFLSTITVIPSLYASFVADQFMSIFAMALPYTNPFKYNHYVVSLAHHVIAVWFLKCRLPFRKDFVRFITNGLQTNSLIPFEESKLNQDSSDRKRSSSLTEQTSRRRERSTTLSSRPQPPLMPESIEEKPKVDKNLIAFYKELTETSIDFMARYTFSPCTAKPTRLPTSDFILKGGHSSSWIVGNRIITITTSGCNQNVFKWGLCDKCLQCCRIEADNDLLNKSESGSSGTSRQNSGENPVATSPSEEGTKLSDRLFSSRAQSENDTNKKLRCCCWCQGWCEVYIRRPTGDVSWTLRIQNSLYMMQSLAEFPLNDVARSFMPSYEVDSPDYKENIPEEEGQSQATSRDDIAKKSISDEASAAPDTSSQYSDFGLDDLEPDVYEDDVRKSRNPVRRSNSSPEMSANWKNPFLAQKEGYQDDEVLKKKSYTKDMRVSCEAIPEEIAGMGTTPPSEGMVLPPKSTNDQPSLTTSGHPTLLSCYSYPGSSSQGQGEAAANNLNKSQTVPPSPNILQSNTPLSLTSSSNRDSQFSLRSSKSLSTESYSSDKGIERQAALEGLPPLTSKPPHSPLSKPRHSVSGHEIQKSSSLVLEKSGASNMSSTTSDKLLKGKLDSSGESDSGLMRDRGYTISVMSPVRKPLDAKDAKSAQEKQKDLDKERERKKDMRSGNMASFIFLQLYHSAQCEPTTEKPILIPQTKHIQTSVKLLDCIPPYEVHKIGVIYVGKGQCNKEIEILKNEYGSYRFNEYLKGLGSLIKLSDVDPQQVFLGGLEQTGADGNFAYVWHDDIIRVMFHVATLFPNKETDPQCTNKKRHIGNDNITIVYNESGEEYDINTIRGQFNFACVIVQPLDHGINRVTIKGKPEWEKLAGVTQPKIVSDQSVPILTRQLALHADLAALVQTSLIHNSEGPYASHWLNRLRRIKQIKQKILQEDAKKKDSIEEQTAKTRRMRIEDFTEYT